MKPSCEYGDRDCRITLDNETTFQQLIDELEPEIWSGGKWEAVWDDTAMQIIAIEITW